MLIWFMKIFILITLFLIITSCSEYKYEEITSTIESIGSCTNATDGNAWSDDPQPSLCRVKLKSGQHINLHGPVMIGENVVINKVLEKVNENSEWKHRRYEFVSRY